MRYSESRWRNEAAPIIAKVLEENRGKDEKEIKKALHDAYPFGERQYHPYRIWLDEIRRQRGLKWPIGHKRKWENGRARMTKEQEKFAEWESLYGGGQ